MSDILLDIKNLNIVYSTTDGVVRALNDANLQIRRGEALGLVGETGAGKTTLARGIMRLIPHPPGEIVSGEIIYEGHDLLRLTEKEMRQMRGRQISMIFQDPMTSLNPVMTVGEQILEVIRNHHPEFSRQEAKKQAGDMLEMVGITAGRYDDYPHQFSGGMKQRVIIAIALACNPQLLIADEPTTALDVTIQDQIMKLINELKQELGMSVILVTHDLGVIAQMCDRVAVMYSGLIMEMCDVVTLFASPRHPYTYALMSSLPDPENTGERLNAIQGSPPNLAHLPEGCPFSPRCTECAEICKRQRPEMYEIAPGHYVRCHCLDKTAAYRGIIDAASVEEGAGKHGESTV